MKYRITVILLIILLFIFSMPVTAFKTFESDGSVTVDEVIDNDVYVAGGNVFIGGKVLGDVVAAGGLVEINGNVTGDVIVGGGTVIISGDVGDDVRVGSGTLIVNGHVGDDLVVGGGNVIISSTADIGGGVLFGSGMMELRGKVWGDVSGAAGTMTLSGQVGGNMDIEVDELVILPTARVNGSLTYQSLEEVAIPAGVVDEIHFTKKETRPEYKAVSPVPSIVWWLVKYLALLVVGLLALYIFPGRTASAAGNVTHGPLKNLVWGFLLTIAGIVGSILLCVTIIGIPLGIFLFFVTIAVLYAARLIVAFWLGKYIFSKLGQKSRPGLEMALGIFVLLLFTSLPWAGVLIHLAVTFIAIGVLFHEEKKFYAELKAKNMI